MDVIENIMQWVEGLLDDDDFIVDIKMNSASNNPKVQVLIDSDKELTIDTCAKISRSIGHQIEESNLIDGKYILEVSSPGLDHPLKHFRQYKKNKGRNVKVECIDGVVVEGELIGVSEEMITISKGKGKDGKMDDTVIDIPFDRINKTMVLIIFNK
jgi:ribosome maturation factor RimP